MQQHGVNPWVQVGFFSFFSPYNPLNYMNLTRIQMQFSINYREMSEVPSRVWQLAKRGHYECFFSFL